MFSNSIEEICGDVGAAYLPWNTHKSVVVNRDLTLLLMINIFWRIMNHETRT